MSNSQSPWWAELAFESPINDFSTCVACGESVDSMDVVCPIDDTSLLGAFATERAITIAAYVLRGLVVLAALAIGYLRWAWPTYCVGVILALTFALLFLRNHRTALRYLAVVGLLVGAGHGLLMATDYFRFGDIFWVALTVVFISDLAFIVGMTRLVSEDNVFPQIGTTTQTTMTGSLGLVTFGATILLALLGHFNAAPVPSWLSWASLHGAPLAISVTTFALLVSAIAYTIHSPDFSVRDPVLYREILGVVRFGRIPSYARASVNGELERLIVSLERLLIRFANSVTSAIETAYNSHIRAFVNRTAQLVVALVNALYRLLVKTGRHIARVAVRFAVLTLYCVRWSASLSRRFATAFLLPAMLAWIACTQLWSIACEIRGYILSDLSWATPVFSLLRIVLVLTLLAGSTAVMLEASPGKFASKLSAAGASLGGRAFLFFVFVAWSLGLLGWLTGGPFHVGWVTLVSTTMIIAALLALRARRAIPAVS
jgi:hypothetical protein